MGFRVLCFNCNLARGFYGVCPHEAPDAAAALGLKLEAGEVTAERRCTRCQRNLPRAAFYADKGGPAGLLAAEFVRAGRLLTGCGRRVEQLWCITAAVALDHITGNGPRQPGGRTGGNSFYVWLRNQGYPVGLRSLCHNCNGAMGRGRECPHKLGTSTR